MISSTSSPWRYRENTSDFGVDTRTLLVANESDSVNFHHTPSNLREVGKELGLKIIPTQLFYYPRDAKIRIPSGSLLRSTDIDDTVISVALERCWKRENHLKNGHARVATTHPSFHNLGQGTAVSQKHYRRTAEGFKTDSLDDYYANTGNFARSNIPVKIKPSRSYWEGGNVITASNRAGEIKVLVGADSATITHQALRNSGFFRPPGDLNTHYINETLNNEFKDSIRTLYVRGQVPTKVKELAPKLSEEDTLVVAHEMQAIGLLPVIKKEEKEKLTDIVTDYLGQREFVKKVLWPAEFGVDTKNIIEIPQAAYHLDAFLKPGPRGSFFVQDFEKSEEFLQSLLARTDLTEKDRTIVASYLADAALLKKDLKPIYDQVQTRLREAGFTLIPTPGSFYGKEGDKRVDLNFLNAVSGWSQEKQSYYYICLGAKVGDNLGKAMMETYQEFLQTHGVSMRVYFVGYDPKNPGDFSEAMSFSAAQNSQSGVHCLTYELETKAHTDP